MGDVDENLYPESHSGTSEQQSLYDFLCKSEAKIEEIKKELKVEYDAEALENFEKFFTNTGECFTEMLYLKKNEYFECINKTEGSQTKMGQVIKDAYNVATYFFNSLRNQPYERPRCKQVIQKLIVSIKNMKSHMDDQDELKQNTP